MAVADSGKLNYSTQKEAAVNGTTLQRIGASVKQQYPFTACEKCKGDLVIINAIDHLILECSHNKERGCNVSYIVPDDFMDKAVKSLQIPCDRCGTGMMKYRRGKFGPFISCDKFPSCRNLVDFKKMR